MAKPHSLQHPGGTQISPRLFTERIGCIIWRVRADDPPTWWRCVLAGPDDWLGDPSRYLKNSRNVTLARIPAPDPGQRSLILRRLNYGRWRYRLSDFFRRSRAQRAFQNMLALEAAGLPVARALAVAVIRHFRWPVRAYVVSDEIECARTLAEMVRLPHSVSHGTVEALAKVIARLHEAGFIHGDLKATNILINAQGQPWLVDFDGVRRFVRVTRARAVKEIARLAVGVIEAGGRMELGQVRRFLRQYCAERGAKIRHHWFSDVRQLVNRQLRNRPALKRASGRADH